MRLLSQILNTVVKDFWQNKKRIEIFNLKNAIDLSSFIILAIEDKPM